MFILATPTVIHPIETLLSLNDKPNALAPLVTGRLTTRFSGLITTWVFLEGPQNTTLSVTFVSREREPVERVLSTFAISLYDSRSTYRALASYLH